VRSSTREPNRPGNSILDPAVKGLRVVDGAGTVSDSRRGE